MNNKLISIIAVSLAVIVVAVSSAVFMVKRADAARGMAEAADRQESVAREQAKALDRQSKVEESKRIAAEKAAESAKLALEQAKVDERRAAEAARAADAEARAAKSKADQAKAEWDAADLRRQTERDRLKTAENTNSTVLALLKIEELKYKETADKLALERLAHEREREVRMEKQLRKEDLDRLQVQLSEWEHDLRQRERAIEPEKTIADLAWAGDGKDSVIDDKGNVVRVEKEPYMAENDKSLSAATRELARISRIESEKMTNRVESVKNAVVTALERLYAEALQQNRPLDAEYYAKSIRVMYPDWKFRKEETDAGK